MPIRPEPEPDRKLKIRVADDRSVKALQELQQEYDRLRNLVEPAAGRPVDGTTVHTRATTYTVSCLPDDPHSSGSWDITVEFRGAWMFLDPRPEDQQWAVVLRGHWNLSRDSKWDLRPSKDDDGYDDWLIAHRFDLETALKVAAEQAPHVVVNGMTPAGVLEWRAARGTTHA